MRESVTLKIKSADTMTKKERLSAATWLRQQAIALVTKPTDYYDRVHVGRYYTEERSNDRRRAR